MLGRLFLSSLLGLLSNNRIKQSSGSYHLPLCCTSNLRQPTPRFYLANPLQAGPYDDLENYDYMYEKEDYRRANAAAASDSKAGARDLELTKWPMLVWKKDYGSKIKNTAHAILSRRSLLLNNILPRTSVLDWSVPSGITAKSSSPLQGSSNFEVWTDDLCVPCPARVPPFNQSHRLPRTRSKRSEEVAVEVKVKVKHQAHQAHPAPSPPVCLAPSSFTKAGPTP